MSTRQPWRWAIKRIGHILLLMVVALLTLGADLDRVRFEKVGHELMCTCGCNQILLECNHAGCPVSDGMRKQIADGLQGGRDNQAILQGFVERFGPTVLAAPTRSGFDRIAWITPFAVFALGIAAAIFVVRKWQRRRPSTTFAGHTDNGLAHYARQARKETEL